MMKKILAIDDRKDNLTTLEAVLQNNISDCKVLTALSGEEGIKIAQKEQPDTILLDIIMPQMDGYEVCKKLKEDELTKHIPVIMITAIKIDKESRIKGLNMGADAFLSKPIDPMELSAQVNVMLRIKEAEDKLKEEQADVFKMLTTNSRDLIYRMSIPDGVYEYVSPASTELFGHTPDDFYKNPILIQEVIHPDWQNYFKERWEDLIIGVMPPTYEYQIINKSGKTCWINQRNTLIKDENGKPIAIIGNVTDISESKQIEEALKESENNLRTLFNSMTDIVFELDYDGRYLNIAPTSPDLMFKPSEDIIGKLIHEVFPKSEADNFLEFIRKSLDNNETITIEYPLNIKNKTIWFEGRATPKTKNSVLFIAHDISDRRKAEEELRESEKKFSSIVDSSPMGMHIYSLEPDGKLIFRGANPAADTLLGVDNSQFIGKTIEEAFPPLADTEIPAAYKDVASQGKKWKTEQIVYQDNKISGAFAVFAFQTLPRKMVALFQDITERKQADDALTQQREKLTDILKGTNAGTWDWNIQTGELVLNARWAEIMGYTLEELKPIDVNTWINNVHPDDLPYANALLDKHFKKETDYYDVEFRQPHKDGSFVWVNARGKIVEWAENGKPLQMSGTHLDITERKQAEEALKSSEERLKIIFESAPDAFYLSNLKGYFLDGNKAAEELLGVKKEELVGKSFLKLKLLSAKELPKAAKALAKNLLGKKTGPDEFLLSRKDGSTVPVEISTYPVKIKNIIAPKNGEIGPLGRFAPPLKSSK